MSLRAVASSFQSVNYQGTWDASANTPTLTSSVGTKGHYYVVSVAGSTNLNGITNWGVGDWAVFNGSAWQRVEGGADGNFVNLSISGTASFANGTVSAPAITITGDTNTGIFFPVADTIAASTAGAERMRIDSAGRVGIGGAATTGEMLALRNTAETTASVFGLRNLASINQATTTTAYGISDQTQILSPAALTNLFRFRAASGGFTGTVTNQYGYAADSGLTGATNNYGFHSNIASGAGRFNFFAAGTAANVFVGTTSIGGNPGAESFRVTPVSSSVNYLNVQGAITTASPSITAAGSDTNIDLTLTTKGTGVLSFGTYTAGVVAQAGYITIKDAGGATRRLLVG